MSVLNLQLQATLPSIPRSVGTFRLVHSLFDFDSGDFSSCDIHTYTLYNFIS